jgi:hypothetical protein
MTENTDDTRYSVPAVWSRLYHELKGSPWEDHDLDIHRYWHNEPSEHAPAVTTLKHVYDLAKAQWSVDPEDAVLAVLKAAYQHHRTAFLTPGQVKEMARNYSIRYESMDEPLEDELKERSDGIELDWLNDRGIRGLRAAVIREDEIWIEGEPNLSGVWVFNKP